jgi:hypothetical protein
MNLGKLLGAGKSFFGGRKNVSYREDKHVYLPKFNAPKNPFLPKAEEKPAAAAPAAPVAKKVLAAPAPFVASVPSVASVKPAAVKTAKPAVFTAQKPLRAPSWTEKLNPFRAPEPVAPMLRAEQTELSLDAVKVLHNDLSDGDVDYVPVKSRTLAPAEAPRLAGTRQPLEFFSERQMETV